MQNGGVRGVSSMIDLMRIVAVYSLGCGAVLHLCISWQNKSVLYAWEHTQGTEKIPIVNFLPWNAQKLTAYHGLCYQTHHLNTLMKFKIRFLSAQARNMPFNSTIKPIIHTNSHFRNCPILILRCSFKNLMYSSWYFSKFHIQYFCFDIGCESVRRGKCVRTAGFCSPRPGRFAAGTPPPMIHSTREDPFWSRFCCVNAIILMCVNIFLYAYYA